MKCNECFQDYPEDALTLVGEIDEEKKTVVLKYFCPLCFSIKIRHPNVYSVQLPPYLIIKTRG